MYATLSACLHALHRVVMVIRAMFLTTMSTVERLFASVGTVLRPQGHLIDLRSVLRLTFVARRNTGFTATFHFQSASLSAVICCRILATSHHCIVFACWKRLFHFKVAIFGVEVI